MENCLVKKLKASVNADIPLVKLNGMRINIKEMTVNTHSHGMVLKSSIAQEIKIYGGYFTDGDLTSNRRSTETLEANTEKTIYWSNNDAVILIDDKRYLLKLSGISGGSEKAKSYYYNLDDFRDVKSLVSVSCNNSDCYGSIESLGECKNLTGFDFQKCANIYGDLALLIESLCDNGKSSLNEYVYTGNTSITLNGSAITASRVPVKINSTTSFNITYSDTKYIYTKSDNVWSYTTEPV